MINRTIAPPIHITEGINIPHPSIYNFSNGTTLLVVDSGDVDVCRVDIVFNAGSQYQSKKLVASATMSLMSEGTAKHSSQEISEYFDFWGSFISISADKDFAKATAYSLTKYLPQTLQMLEEVIKSPTFPNAELDVWKRRGKQSLTVELDKPSTLARMEFFKTIYGLNHPYGSYALPNDYELLEQNELAGFHQSTLGSQGATILLSGKISDDQIKLVQKHFGDYGWGTSTQRNTETYVGARATGGNVFVQKDGAVQSAVRVGRVLFNRSHPDYPDLAIVNAILGGYFGSRLMKNIREEKGFTYGIGSYLLTFRDSGALVIATEVGSGYTKQTLQEIKNEIYRLQTEPVQLDELTRVRSYLMGEALRSFNGPFAIADNMLSLLYYNNLDFEFYNRVVDSIKRVSPDRIMELAQKWFNYNDMVECVAGAENPFN
ncbi:MAG: pitrilysin family protein [Tenuifilaceae bacterium]|jgi:predicted Zn-dependent peptidase|nr:pitrilysin family protein [Tenuifilaceae bacterium]